MADSSVSKRCLCCGETKPREVFHKALYKTPVGKESLRYTAYCLVCEARDERRCTQCGEWKPSSEFRTYKEVSGVNQRRLRQRTECRVCAALRCKERKERIRTAELEIAQKRWQTLAPEKRCYLCGNTKAIEHFRKVNYITSTGKQSWHFSSGCMECERQKDRERYQNNREHEKARQREYNKNHKQERTATAKRYRERNPEKVKLWQKWGWSRARERLYGIDVVAFDAFMERHGNRCNICDSTGDAARLCIDHCHKTGKLRGVLCAGCNLAVGNIREDAARARRLAEYIEKQCG